MVCFLSRFSLGSLFSVTWSPPIKVTKIVNSTSTYFSNERHNLIFFTKAKNAVVSTQFSSRDAERVFSQLKLIEDQCGSNMMEDMLQIRMFERCNGDISML